MRLSTQEYQAIKPIAITRLDEINLILKNMNSDSQIFSIIDKSDFSWAGLVAITLEQYEMLRKWDQGLEYPYFQVNWYILNLYPESYCK